MSQEKQNYVCRSEARSVFRDDLVVSLSGHPFLRVIRALLCFYLKIRFKKIVRTTGDRCVFYAPALQVCVCWIFA